MADGGGGAPAPALWHPSRRNRALGPAALGLSTEQDALVDVELSPEHFELEEVGEDQAAASSRGDVRRDGVSDAPAYIAAPERQHVSARAVAGFDALTSGEYLWTVSSVVLVTALCSVGIYLGIE